MESEIREDAIQDDKKEKLKRKAFEKHKKIIELTIMCGNQVALVPQLIEILLNTNTYKNKKQVYDALTLLEKHKLIYKKDFGSCKYIELRNPTIKWAIEGSEGLKERFGDLYSTNKKSTASDNMLFTSMFKFEYLINMSKLQKFKLDEMIELFLKKASLFYTRGRGYDFFENIKIFTAPQLGEFIELRNDLYIQKQKQKLSGIKEKHLTKEQKKQKSDLNKYILQFDKYNLNSLLSNDNLMLTLNKQDIYTQDFEEKFTFVNKVDLFFNLYIFDIRNNLEVNDIAKLSARVYTLLYNMFKRSEIIEDCLMSLPFNSPCFKCERCIYNRNYDSENKDITPCDPRKDSNREKCKKVISFKMARYIYLDINYISWDKEKASAINVDVNTYAFEEGCLKEEPKLKDKILNHDYTKQILTTIDYDNYIKFNSVSYNLERYGVNKGEDNITEYNERQEQKAIYKEEVKNNDEFLQTVLFLKDNLELLQVIKDNLDILSLIKENIDDFRGYLFSKKYKDNLIDNEYEMKEEEELAKYYEMNFDLTDELDEEILEFDINDVEY